MLVEFFNACKYYLNMKIDEYLNKKNLARDPADRITLQAFADLCGICRETLYHRIKNGWSVDDNCYPNVLRFVSPTGRKVDCYIGESL